MTMMATREAWRPAGRARYRTSADFTSVRRAAAGWLCLAATPVFVAMAVLTAVPGAGPQNMICAAAPDASPLTGMGAMYLLMAVFHAAPWLKLMSRRQPPPCC